MRATAVLIGTVVALGRGRAGRLLRGFDQRTRLFSPLGAGLYARLAPPFLRPLYRRVADEVAAVPGLGAVLDVGSGSGDLAIKVARRLPDVEVIGVDLAKTMVAHAEGRAWEGLVADRVRFLTADAASMPLPDHRFDVAVSTLSLHHWADPSAVFKEIGRVLRPGGVALVYDLRFVAYDQRELEAFLAGGQFAASGVERTLVRLGRLPPLFVRIRLIRNGS